MLEDDVTPSLNANVGKRGPGRPTLTNEQLLDAALEIFLEKGFERTSIDAIVASVGMAKRTVYIRYGDKSALFKAALQRAIEAWIVPVEVLREAETDDFEETLVRIGKMLVTNVLNPVGLRLLRMTNAESARMPEISAYAYREGTQPTLIYLADLFRRRIATMGRELPNADQAALAYLQLVVAGPGSLTGWGVAFDLSDLEQHVRYSVKFFLHGLYASAEGGLQAPIAGAPVVLPRLSNIEGATDAHGGQGDSPTLREENRRLRTLLVDAMVKFAELQERFGPTRSTDS